LRRPSGSRVRVKNSIQFSQSASSSAANNSSGRREFGRQLLSEITREQYDRIQISGVRLGSHETPVGKES
jgi:hypothetical protein